jgi:hypothetical protein
MFELKFNFAEFEKKAQQMNAALGQVPYALSLTLNRAAENARQTLIERTWPSSVTVRNPTFMNAALRVRRSTKTDLRIEVYDRLGRANLAAHARGAVVRPKQARVFAVPMPGTVKRGAKGVYSKDRPRNLKGSFTTVRGIFVRQHGQAKLIYVFKPSITVKKDVPFIDDFIEVMRNEMRTNFGPAMARAMATRKR